MKRNWCKWLAVLACLAMLCTLLPLSAAASDAVEEELLVTGGETSVRDANPNSNGLAFLFEVPASGTQAGEDYSYVSGSAVTAAGQHKVLRVGAVVTNKSSVALDGMTLDAVNGKKVIDIPARYLHSVGDAGFAYAVRIVNIPNEKLDAKIYVRPYVVYEGENGAEVEEYGETVNQSYSTAVIPEDERVNQQVKELLKTKHPLTYNEDGSFRVLILADAHMNTNANATDVQEVKDRIKLLVDRVDPNLVIYTGDNTINSYTETSARANIDAIVGYVEEKQIPWCHVYGNHDEEYGMSKAKQQAVYESYEYCVSKSGPEDIFGVGNYALGVYKQDGSLGSVIYCLDSGAYATEGGYDYVKNDQVQWYKEASELLQEYNGGEKVPALMAFHIPLYENRLAYDNRNDKDVVSEWNGERNEDICSSKADRNDLFETILERGDVKATVSGHDHINDYMFNYYGVKLCNSPNISDLEYHDHRMQGARVFDMNLDTIDDIPTYVTYVIERIDPNLVKPLADNGTLVYTDADVEGATITGYDQSGLSGTVTFKPVAGKGVNGSDAIEMKRSVGDNYEIRLSSKPFKVGNNQYLVVWMDFTNVEFRKACFGFETLNGTYRTDDEDKESPFYYLPDGSTQWETMNHGWDGCFGADQSSSIEDKKGYFAFPIDHFQKGMNKWDSSVVVTGVYFYGSVKNNSEYFNQPVYIDDIRLAVDYQDLF